MVIPSVGIDGVRQTVNAHLTRAQRTWNLRSALNVAALNCLSVRHAAILPAYKGFLDRNVRKLSATNKAVQEEFRKKYGQTYRDVQDSYMTQVYNYFALPPALDEFCDAATAVSLESQTITPDNLDVYAEQALPRIEAVFEKFFRSYEQYRVDVAAWDAKYGTSGMSGPGTFTNASYLNRPAVSQTSTGPVAVAGNTPPGASLPTQGVIFRSGEITQPAATPTPRP